MTKMTAKEKAMILAIINSGFVGDDDSFTNEVPLIVVMPQFGPSAGGIMASLSNKGWAHSYGRAIGGEILHDDEGYVWLTDAGVEAIRAHDEKAFLLANPYA